MVMPRSRSRSMESSTCASISRDVRPPVRSMMRSASVDLPWSMWAMMEKLRMWSMSLPRNIKGHADVPFCIAAILLHPGEARIHCLGVQEVVADLEFPIEEDRNLVAPFVLQAGVAVDIDHLDLEVITALELLQGRYEVFTKMAVLARQDRELRLHAVSRPRAG